MVSKFALKASFSLKNQKIEDDCINWEYVSLTPRHLAIFDKVSNFQSLCCEKKRCVFALMFLKDFFTTVANIV